MSDAGDAGAPVGGDHVLAGRYRMVRPLATGGMAVVWEARDEILARPVAVKVPHAGLAADPRFRERFRREAVAAARLAHPGIVATYDTGADGLTDFIVMELVPGRTVRDLVAGGPVPPHVAVPLMAQVAEALDVAHKAGIVHRDIKPANLLLVEDGPALRVKVADFGVAWARAAPQSGNDRARAAPQSGNDEARAAEREAQDSGPGGPSVPDDPLLRRDATKDGLVVGTARYLAPEQVAAQPLDGRTDVYAVGCVLHELLSGQPPFTRDSDLATALAHLTEPAPALRSLGVSVEPAIETLVLSCLAKDPADRPASALALAQQLRALAAPPVAPPTTPVPVVELAGLRHGAASSAPGTVALPVGAAASSHQARGGGAPPHGARAAPQSGEARAQAAPQSGKYGARAAPQSGQPLRGAAPPAAGGRRSGRHGTRTVGRPTRSRVPLVVVGLLVVAALATALFVVALPSERPTATRATRTSTAPPSGPPVVVGVRSFDPEADGRENEAQLPRLIDGKPATTWSSDRYNLRPVFGNLKKGLGVVLTLERPAQLDGLTVRSPSRAWAAQVYVADTPAATLPGWGQPVARASDVQGDLELDIEATSGGAVLVWFTDPGRTGQMVVGELELQAP